MQAEQCVRMELDGVCELGRYCLDRPASPEYEVLVEAARARYTADGVATLPGFLGPAAIKTAVKEVERAAGREWFTRSTHNVFLDSGSPAFLPDHIRNRQLPTQVNNRKLSKMGCVCVGGGSLYRSWSILSLVKVYISF